MDGPYAYQPFGPQLAWHIPASSTASTIDWASGTMRHVIRSALLYEALAHSRSRTGRDCRHARGGRRAPGPSTTNRTREAPPIPPPAMLKRWRACRLGARA
ncbi:hypothetical protein Bcen2424_5574 [Burkholderia cenocepacia HI2424]|nr:hypothetical protein Bcen2424_5574 [Burkholderia cenocepacia HI2424]